MSAIDTEYVNHRITVTAGGCWEWKLYRDGLGYGYVTYHGRKWQAHRLVYTLLRGGIPAGAHLHHICRNPSCVNPDHLMLTDAQHHYLYEPNSVTNWHGKKTHCPNGHPYNEVNTYRTPEGKRHCRICNRAAAARLKIKRRAGE